MFESRSILLVEQNEKEEPLPPEPGEPEPYVPDIRIEHNVETNLSYMFIDKKFFEDLTEPETEELIYQLFNQGEFNRTAQYPIEMQMSDKSLKEVNIEVEALEWTEEEEKEKEESASEAGACDMASAAEDATADKTEEGKTRETQVTIKDIAEEDKEKNPRFKAGNAAFKKGRSTSASKQFRSSSSIENLKEIPQKQLKEITKVQEILEHAIKGDDGGKEACISPSKKLNMKAIITESSEKEYIGNHAEEGKTIKINMIVDRSGSMTGSPTQNSNILIQALNNLSFEYPEMDVQIMLSETSHFFTYSMPIEGLNSKQLWDYNRTGSAEGLSRTFEAHFDRMKEADINLVYTDGSIMDEAIDKAYMKAQEIELTGLYVNEDFTPEEVMSHVEQNKQYFTRTIIRKTAIALVNELANMLVMNKGNYS